MADGHPPRQVEVEGQHEVERSKRPYKPHMNKRIPKTCSNCQKRHVKCDRVYPCTSCCLNGTDAGCEYDRGSVERYHQALEIRRLRSENEEQRKSTGATLGVIHNKVRQCLPIELHEELRELFEGTAFQSASGPQSRNKMPKKRSCVTSQTSDVNPSPGHTLFQRQSYHSPDPMLSGQRSLPDAPFPMQVPGSIYRQPISYPPEDRDQQLPGWGQTKPPPPPAQKSPREQINFGQESLQTNPVLPSQHTFPMHVTNGEMNPVPGHTLFQSQSNDSPCLILPGQRSLPDAPFPIQVPSSIFDCPMTEAGQVFTGTSNSFDWDACAQDYEMYDRMGSLSQGQQTDLMQQLDVDRVEIINNMNVDGPQAPWNNSGYGYYHEPNRRYGHE